jgi:hypothetical protein
MSFTSIEWPRCKHCNNIFTRGFNDKFIRVIASDSENRPYHIYKEDCSEEHPGYKGEEAEIVY